MSINIPLWRFSILVLVYVFLYSPILILVIYSFNSSRLVTVWAGFSTKWYAELIHNEAILQAAWLSLRIAATSATIATVLGFMAGWALARYPRFRGRTAFSGLVNAPLVMPDIILGISMLMLFVAMQQGLDWPQGRGMLTIAIAHITFSTAYVAIIVHARALSFDRALEDAALDLGAPPWKIFYLVIAPNIWPALIAGWLLAFTLSLDDLIIASFVSGPGSSTLPIIIYSSVRLGVSPQINALASVLIGIVTITVICIGLVMRPKSTHGVKLI